jgi:outer membrane protein OmpA-like peptidoglycan-associated protein
MKKLALFCVIAAIVMIAPGCGKKKECKKDQTVNKEVPASKKYKKSKQIASNDIPVYNKENEFLDDDDVSNFAFVDDEQGGAKQATKKVAAAEKDSVTSAQVHEKAKALAFVNNDDNTGGARDLDKSDLFGDDERGHKNYAFKTVHFDFDKDIVRDDEQNIIDEDAEVAKNIVTENKKLVVQGHCCQIGSHSYNMALSERRAETVRDELISRGVDSENIKVVGFGNEMPLVWSNKKDRASLIKELSPNRRAEFVVN